MSLKAKIEAVIYASEEPVTLSQLVSLLGQEAQAELNHLHAAQDYLPLDVDAVSLASQPDADIEGASPVPGDPESETTESDSKTRMPVEPAPTDTAPENEPEPTEASPIPEHPAPAKHPAPAEQAAPAEHPAPAEQAAAEQASAEQASAEQAPATQKEKSQERKLRDHFRSLLDELVADYATSARGLEVREVAGGYRFATKPEYHDAVRGFMKSLKPPLKLSLQALETLAVVAYKQPVTGPEISDIRGVDSGGVLGSLLARKLIATAGRKQVIGRPILYKTTRDFLLRFGLKDVSELPSIEEFEKMAGELADIEPTLMEPAQEKSRMPGDDKPRESARELEDELAETAEPAEQTNEPQADGTPVPLEGSDESSAGVPAGTAADEVLTDGRISGLPPSYNSSAGRLSQRPGEEAPFDSPAMDAELQREQAEETAVGLPERI